MKKFFSYLYKSFKKTIGVKYWVIMIFLKVYHVPTVWMKLFTALGIFAVLLFTVEFYIEEKKKKDWLALQEDEAL